MSHHGDTPFQDFGAFREEMERLAKTEYRGPVGAYPHGKLSKNDEGSIQFAIGDKDGKVVLDFGSPVAWIGLTPQQALDLASSIMSKARAVARENGETVHVTIGG